MSYRPTCTFEGNGLTWILGGARIRRRYPGKMSVERLNVRGGAGGCLYRESS